MASLCFPKAVLFDWDNTLVDSHLGCFYNINNVLQHFNRDALTLEVFSNQLPLSIKDYFRNIFPSEQDYVQAQHLYSELASEYQSYPFPDAELLLNWLKSHGIPMAVVSNKEGGLLEKEIHGLNWQDYFYGKVGSYDAPEDKPSAVPLLYALSKKDLNGSEDIWFVGDSIIDVVCAHNAQCLPILLDPEENIGELEAVRVNGCKGVYHLLQTLHDVCHQCIPFSHTIAELVEKK